MTAVSRLTAAFDSLEAVLQITHTWLLDFLPLFDRVCGFFFLGGGIIPT